MLKPMTMTRVAVLVLGAGAVALAGWGVQPDKPIQPGAAPRPAQPESVRARPRPDQPEEAAHPADNPGAPHESLMKLAGTWEIVSTFAMGDQKTEPTDPKGRATIRAIHGGRFLHNEWSETMMGEPGSGTWLLGYNNATKKYEATWVYSASTATLNLSGTSPDSGATIGMAGSYEAAGQGTHHLKVQMKIVSNDEFTVRTTGDADEGAEAPVFETVYTRAK